MGIDVSKPAPLVRVLSALAIAGGLAGCGEAAGTPTRMPAKPVTSNTCLVAAEAIRPPVLTRDNVATYSGGVVVNQAGTIADLNVVIPNIERINTDPALSLDAGRRIKITYFFAGSFTRPDAVAQVEAFSNALRPYLDARYCEEQVEPLNNALTMALSLSDIRDETIKNNPNLVFGSPDWQRRFEDQIGRYYIIRTRSILSPGLVTPLPPLSNQAIDQALNKGLPFKVVNLRPLPTLTK